MDSLPINDEEDISLSPETLAILNEFLAAKSQSADGNGSFTEDWQLSQFWYTSDTCKQIVDESLASLGPSDNNLVRIACISCPSLIPHFLNTRHYNDGSLEVKLFEFDKRFQQSYPEVFVFYDYNNPLDIQLEYQHNFDYIIADPPFLSEACFVKIAQTIRFLAKVNGCKLLVCTGTVMEELLRRLLKLRKTTFEPKHTNNLANDFSSFANYEPKTF